MSTHEVDKDTLKQILNQIAGTVGKNTEPIPEVGIKGRGYIWCYDLLQKRMVRVACESKCYILDHTQDADGKILVYTPNNDVILIEESKILYTGYD
tara:strand:+ start:221 stop:508 length:288 start_codon:yes stop_codon:yes gene_type:complete